MYLENLEENTMKKTVKILALSLAAILLCVSLTACGGSSGSASLSKIFVGSDAVYLDGIGWYSGITYTLKVNSDNTYELIYQNHVFGTTDPGVKGLRTIIYTGKCSSAASSDGWETHVDYTLEPATRIFFEQHEKGFGRSTLAGHMVLDSENWTDAMTQSFDPEGNAKGAKEFLSEFAQSLTITVEDPTLDAEDVSLGFRIVNNPELKLVTYAG